MKQLTLLLVLLSLVSVSCQKEDEAIVLPLPGDVLQLVAPMGSNYDDQVYVSLSKGKIHVMPYRNYDLAFEASAQGFHIYLNGAKYMFASRTTTSDFFLADSSNANWCVDAEQLYADSTAIGNWWVQSAANGAGLSNVFIIDRGRMDHSGAGRFRKLQVMAADDVHYEIRFSNLDNSNVTVMNIPKDPAYSLMYFSFENNGTVVQQAPPSQDWDFVFTKYTHVYFDEPLNSPYRYYPVTGAGLNIWNQVSGSVMKADSTPNYVPFDQFKYDLVAGMPFTTNADVIGFDWKFYDFNSSRYFITPDLYFVLKDKNGYYFKMRMIDFYDGSGNKGTITLEYQRI